MPDLSHPIISHPPLAKRNHTGEPWPCQRRFSAAFSLFASLGSFKCWLLTAHLAIAQRGVAARHRNGAAEWTGTAAWSSAPPGSLARAWRGAGKFLLLHWYHVKCYAICIQLLCIMYIIRFTFIYFHLMGSHGQHWEMVVCLLMPLVGTEFPIKTSPTNRSFEAHR